jgi:hypothetical protein
LYSPNRSTIFVLLCTTVISLAVVPATIAQPSVASNAPKAQLKPVYSYLQSEMSINLPGYHPLVNVSFTTISAVNATVHFSVGTFVPVGGCCASNYLELIAVDNGPPGGSQGLGCGGETSQVNTGVLVGVSCFGRLSFSPGTHSVSLVLFGAGPFTVEHGPSTALLIQFD